MAEKKETPANKNTFGVMKNLGLSAKDINAAVDRLKGVKTSEVGVPRPTALPRQPVAVPVAVPQPVAVPRITGPLDTTGMVNLPGTIKNPALLEDIKLSFMGMTPEEKNKVDTYLSYMGMLNKGMR